MVIAGCGILNGEFVDGITLFIAITCSLGTSLAQCFGGRMPIGSSAHREQSHGKWRGVDNSNTTLLEEVEVFGQQVVVQTIVAEIKNTLHRTLLTVLNHPFEVFGLQIGDTDMTYDSLFA